MTAVSRAGQLAFGEFRLSPRRTVTAWRPNRAILVGSGMRLVGQKRVQVVDGRLELGLSYFGFADRHMKGLVRVRGELRTDGRVRIAVGNRWDIGPDANVTVASDTYFAPAGYLISSNRISVGERCAISWEVQLLDNDFHPIRYGDTSKPESGPIRIGDDVWIGTRATVLKDTRIGDGCVVAAGSIVRGDFSEPRCLIAGTPARVVRKGVHWKTPTPRTAA